MDCLDAICGPVARAAQPAVRRSSSPTPGDPPREPPRLGALAHGGGELIGGEFPVRQFVEPGFQEAFTVVLMVQIVGVFPNIADQQQG